MAVAYSNSDETRLALSGLTLPALPEVDESKVNTGQKILPWFALHVRTRRELIVCSHLQAKRFEYFLPLYKSKRAWSDRVKELVMPLFPGYVFCRMDPQDRLPVLIIPGVFEIVGNSTSPLAVEESEIAAIQSVVKSGLTYEPWPFLPVGTRVRVDHGALQGIQGILTGHKSHCRVVVSVTLLQRSVALEVNREWVSPLDKVFQAAAHGLASNARISCSPHA